MAALTLVREKSLKVRAPRRCRNLSIGAADRLAPIFSLAGFLDFKVNDQRSYDLTAELWISRPGQEDDPLLKRKGSYSLHLQVNLYLSLAFAFLC